MTHPRGSNFDGLTPRSIYVGQRVRHKIAGFGTVVSIGKGRRDHTATVQYDDGPRNQYDGLPPRGIAYIRDLEDADGA